MTLNSIWVQNLHYIFAISNINLFESISFLIHTKPNPTGVRVFFRTDLTLSTIALSQILSLSLYFEYISFKCRTKLKSIVLPSNNNRESCSMCAWFCVMHDAWCDDTRIYILYMWLKEALGGGVRVWMVFGVSDLIQSNKDWVFVLWVQVGLNRIAYLIC